MLKLENVYKTFFPGSPNEKKALQGVSFTLEDGDFATVIGSNGAGKSTVLNSIAGVFPIDSGRIISETPMSPKCRSINVPVSSAVFSRIR